ncbi:nitroreductase family protein [Neomoorella thermoacetica]|uniref:Nitroreductase n=1 Tax=Moorella thermoacetica Y72 TaxID=1325331 RepID=A0A0S6UHI6_NEOTH|nr:nitroreductase family protein [Moorella thermoacetica]APC08377.1 FMN reductase [Moorella thermoacetica]GAF26982.1 nitroreductase [Moorella thermoacetica Y72]
MDTILKSILARRSIRRYTGEPVATGDIKELLEAAMSAPSAGNEQPWHFVVITDRRILDEIPKVHPYSQMLKEAPAAILVCGDLQRQKHKGYWVQDCAAATENILLAAHAKGLGTVWLGVYPREERVAGLQKLLGLPEHIIPLSLIAVGHPAENKPPANRFDPSRVHLDRWNNPMQL